MKGLSYLRSYWMGSMPTFLKCKRCGRLLKDPNSQALGYGPTCLKKVRNDELVQTDLFAFEILE